MMLLKYFFPLLIEKRNHHRNVSHYGSKKNNHANNENINDKWYQNSFGVSKSCKSFIKSSTRTLVLCDSIFILTHWACILPRYLYPSFQAILMNIFYWSFTLTGLYYKSRAKRVQFWKTYPTYWKILFRAAIV